MAEKLCELKKKGGGGSMSETVLWTNPNPTSSFASQSISLVQSLSNFEYLKFVCKARNTITDGSTDATFMVNVEAFKKMVGGTSSSVYDTIYNFAVGAALEHSGSTNYALVRRFVYTNDTTIEALGTNAIGTSHANNAYVIPLQIIGIK